MGKRKFYADPAKDPQFVAIQNEWYKKIKRRGFRDIEDHKVGGFETSSRGNSIDAHHGGRPLKRWTCHPGKIKKRGAEYNPNDIIDHQINQPPQSPILSSFPQPLFRREEQFLEHPEFEKICKELSKKCHKDSKLSSKMIERIWRLYANGISTRKIALQCRGIDHTKVFRTICNLTEWMNFLGGDVEEAKVITRDYKEGDAPCVYSCWRDALWYGRKHEKASADSFYRNTTKKIKKLIKDQGASLRIACLSDDQDHIIGFSVKTNRGSCLEFIYVKKDYRGQGVARLLSAPFDEVANPSTKIGESIVKNKNLKVRGETHGKAQSPIGSDTTHPGYDEAA